MNLSILTNIKGIYHLVSPYVSLKYNLLFKVFGNGHLSNACQIIIHSHNLKALAVSTKIDLRLSITSIITKKMIE